MSDIGKYLLVEKGLRGRISYITKRNAKENNKYIIFMTLKNSQHLYHTFT